MKLVTYEVQSNLGRTSRAGVVLDDSSDLTDAVGIADLNFAYAALLAESGEGRAYEVADALMPPDLNKYMESGPVSHDRARQVIDYISQRPGSPGPRGETLVHQRDQVKLLAPIRPRSARDYTTYEEHMSTRRDSRNPAFYHFPSCYKAMPQSIRGTDDPIIYPSYTEWLDPELELAFVINRPGRNIPISQGASYVGGYTIWLDCSARDIGTKETLGPNKSKDWCTILGPCIVTPDSVDDENARCSIHVNGELWWEGVAGQKRHYGAADLVAWASDHEDLGPNDLLIFGTIGFGCSVDIGRWLKPGDIVEHFIEGIGKIKTGVVPQEGSHNYVRDGLPGRLPLPEDAKGFMDEFAALQETRRAAGHPRPRPEETEAGKPIRTLYGAKG